MRLHYIKRDGYKCSNLEQLHHYCKHYSEIHTHKKLNPHLHIPNFLLQDLHWAVHSNLTEFSSIQLTNVLSPEVPKVHQQKAIIGPLSWISVHRISSKFTCLKWINNMLPSASQSTKWLLLLVLQIKIFYALLFSSCKAICLLICLDNNTKGFKLCTFIHFLCTESLFGPNIHKQITINVWHNIGLVIAWLLYLFPSHKAQVG